MSDKQEMVTVYVNEFTEAGSKLFFEGFKKAREEKQELVPVFIDSYGGYADSVLFMIDTMLGFPGRVATVVVGKAMSCGQILASCGTRGERYATPNSRIMLHQISYGSIGTVASMEVSATESRRLNNQIYKLVAKHCKQPSNYFLDLIKKKGNCDYYMTPQEAKRHKLIDHIRYPSIEMVTTSKIVIK